jgi:hypothetical protein
MISQKGGRYNYNRGETETNLVSQLTIYRILVELDSPERTGFTFGGRSMPAS